MRSSRTTGSDKESIFFVINGDMRSNRKDVERSPFSKNRSVWSGAYNFHPCLFRPLRNRKLIFSISINISRVDGEAAPVVRVEGNKGDRTRRT